MCVSFTLESISIFTNRCIGAIPERYYEHLDRDSRLELLKLGRFENATRKCIELCEYSDIAHRAHQVVEGSDPPLRGLHKAVLWVVRVLAETPSLAGLLPADVARLCLGPPGSLQRTCPQCIEYAAVLAGFIRSRTWSAVVPSIRTVDPLREAIGFVPGPAGGIRWETAGGAEKVECSPFSLFGI